MHKFKDSVARSATFCFFFHIWILCHTAYIYFSGIFDFFSIFEYFLTEKSNQLFFMKKHNFIIKNNMITIYPETLLGKLNICCGVNQHHQKQPHQFSCWHFPKAKSKYNSVKLFSKIQTYNSQLDNDRKSNKNFNCLDLLLSPLGRLTFLIFGSNCFIRSPPPWLQGGFKLGAGDHLGLREILRPCQTRAIFFFCLWWF